VANQRSSWIRPGNKTNARDTGPEKEIQSGREFAKRRWWRNVSPASWPSEGVSSEERRENECRQTGVKKQDQFWKSRWRDETGKGCFSGASPRSDERKMVCSGNADDRAKRESKKKKKERKERRN